MLIVSSRFLVCAPVHATLVLVGALALVCGLWSIPTTVRYAVSQPCTVSASTPTTYLVATADCSSCVEAPPLYQSAPVCPAAAPTDLFCRNGFKCCNTCCDVCSSKGTSFYCNCNCCYKVNDNLCSVTPANHTDYLWEGTITGVPWNTTQTFPPPGALPWSARCVLDTPLTWIPEAFPVEVWCVPVVMAMLGGMAIAVWARRRARQSQLVRQPTIFAMELTTQRPQVRSSLSSALLLIRQEARSRATDASSSSIHLETPTPTGLREQVGAPTTAPTTPLGGAPKGVQGAEGR